VLQGDSIISAISTAIRQRFTEAELAKVYKNKPKQGMVKPCAFIHQINMTQRPELRNRGERNYLIDVRVHPTDKQMDVQSWGRNMAESILSAIDPLMLDDRPLKARSIECRIEEDVLHVIVGYTFKVIKVEEDITPKMEEFTHTISIRRGEP